MMVGGHGGVYLWPTVNLPFPFAAVTDTGPALPRPAKYVPHSTQPKNTTNRNSVHSENSNQPYLRHYTIAMRKHSLQTMRSLPISADKC